MVRFMSASYPNIVNEVAKGGKIEGELQKNLNSALEAFNASWA